MYPIQIYRDASNATKFNSECLECWTVLQVGNTLAGALNSAMMHSTDEHADNRPEITMCQCVPCANSVSQVYNNESE